MARDRELTGTEKKTLLGLVRHPTLNNRELAEVLGLKAPTVTAICRRLRRKGMYRTTRIPLVASLGWEIMSFVWGDVNVLFKDDEVIHIVSNGSDGYPAYAYIVDGGKWAVLGYAMNYTMAQRHLGELVADRNLHQLIEGDIKVLFLPLRLTTFQRLFDNAPLLAKHFKAKGSRERPVLPPKECVRLTKTEMAVLKGLVLKPEGSDKEVAKATGTSRQTVSRLRKEFERDGVMLTVNEVNHVALGYKMYHFLRLRMHPHKSRAPIEEVAKRLVTPEDYMAAYTQTDLVLAGFSKDFADLNAKHRNIKKVLEQYNVSSDEWNFEILTADSLRFVVRHDYENIVRYLDKQCGTCSEEFSSKRAKRRVRS